MQLLSQQNMANSPGSITIDRPSQGRLSSIRDAAIAQPDAGHGGERPDGRFDLLDLVRSVCVLKVFLTHFYWAAHNVLGFSNAPIWSALAENGYGVHCFFVASGFLISHATVKRFGDLFNIKPKEFYVLRGSRILPLFGLFVCFAMALIALTNQPSPTFQLCFKAEGAHFNWVFWTALMSFTFNWYQMIGHTFAGLGWTSLWSLAVEEQFYLLFPLALRRLRTRENYVRLLVALIVFGPITRAIGNILRPDDYMTTMMNSFGAFDLIAMGCLLYLAYEKWEHWLADRKVLAWLFAIGGAGLMAAVFFNLNLCHSGLSQICGPSLLSAGLCFFLFGALSLRIFNRVPVAFLVPGRLCYGMYIWHSLLVLLASSIWTPSNLLVVYLLTAFSLIVCAKICCELFEKPAARIFKRAFGVK